MGETRIWAVVPASGIGARFGAACPKQYAQLRGRPVVQHTLERLAQVPGVSRIVVAVRADDHYWPSVQVALPSLVSSVPGGVERYHSVINALAALEGEAREHDWVAVHDAVRPCVRVADVHHLLQALSGDPIGGLLAVPVRDTIKRTDQDGRVAATVSREGLWQAMTPQVFRYGLLKDALAKCLATGQQVTDEAQAVEHAGYQPRLVEGAADNLKITRPEDLQLAAAVLAAQQLEAVL